MRIILFILLLPFGLCGQEFLELDTKNRCIFDGEMDEELFSFDTDVLDMEQLVADIIRWGGQGEQNFELVQCNVLNAVAVVENGKRYLLWSQDFLEKANRSTRITVVAHEIGHHLNEHSLTAQNVETEEFEADFFMGYVCSRASIPQKIMLEILNSFSTFSKKEKEKRENAAKQGFRQGEKFITVQTLGWDTDDIKVKAFHKKAFTFPRCYQEAELDRRHFSNCETLGSVATTILKELQSKGYTNKSFMSADGGFALITRMEQYKDDGSTDLSPYRWKDTPVPLHFDFSMEYFRSLIFPRSCNLRVFVFVVTDESFGASTEYVDKEGAEDWLNQSVNGLPKSIAASEFGQHHKVHALVYEFKVPDTNHKPQQTCPMNLSAQTHLVKAGLFD